MNLKIKNMKKIMYLMKNGEQRKHASEKEYVSEEHKHEHHEEEHKHEHEESGEMKNSNYFKFIAKHGHHFTKELAKYAVESLNDPMSDEVFCEWIECMKRRKEEKKKYHGVALFKRFLETDE